MTSSSDRADHRNHEQIGRENVSQMVAPIKIQDHRMGRSPWIPGACPPRSRLLQHHQGTRHLHQAAHSTELCQQRHHGNINPPQNPHLPRRNKETSKEFDLQDAVTNIGDKKSKSKNSMKSISVTPSTPSKVFSAMSEPTMVVPLCPSSQQGQRDSGHPVQTGAADGDISSAKHRVG